MSCEHCGLENEEQHHEAVQDVLADYVILTMLARQNPEAAEAIERVVEGWRSHALPVCSPLAMT
jgi:hypothetical protein